MKAIRALFDLIESLGKEEKRQFKLYSNRVGDEHKKYLQLYQVIDKAKAYEEVKLKGKLNKLGLSHLNVKIPYLNTLIIQSLRLQYEDKFIDGQIHKLLSEAYLLEQKGLLERQQFILNKAKEKAKKYERFDALLRILDKQIVYAINHGDNIKDNVDVLHREVEDALEKRVADLQYRRLFFDVFMYQRMGARAQDERDNARIGLEDAKEKLEAAFEKGKPETFNAQINYQFSWALIHYHLDADLQKVNDSYQKIINTWREYPHRIKDDYQLYTTHAVNYLSSCLMLRRFDDIPTVLKELKSIKARSTYDEIRQFADIVYLEFVYLLNLVKFEEAIKLEPIVKKGLEKHGDRIGTTKMIGFYFNMSLLNFALGKYTAAFNWATDIKNKKLEKQEGYYLGINLLQLLAVYEREDGSDFFNYCLGQFARETYKDERLRSFSQFIHKFFQKAISSNLEHRKILFKDTLAKVEQESKETNWGKIPGMEEFCIWLEAKIRRSSFVDILRNKY